MKYLNCTIEILWLVLDDFCTKWLRDGLRFVFSPDVIPSGWLSWTHQLTNFYSWSRILCLRGVWHRCQFSNLIFKTSVHMDLVQFTNSIRNQTMNVKFIHCLWPSCKLSSYFLSLNVTFTLPHCSKPVFSILFSTNWWCFSYWPTLPHFDSD